jgi:hypothetical protein
MKITLKDSDDKPVEIGYGMFGDLTEAEPLFWIELPEEKRTSDDPCK